MNTRIRTSFITLIAAGSLATAALAPAVSQAEDSSGHSVAGAMCESSRTMAKHDIEESVEAVGRGDYDDAAFWSSAATEDLQEADKWCAQAAAEQKAAKVTVVRGGAIAPAPLTPKQQVVRTTAARP